MYDGQLKLEDKPKTDISPKCFHVGRTSLHGVLREDKLNVGVPQALLYQAHPETNPEDCPHELVGDYNIFMFIVIGLRFLKVLTNFLSLIFFCDVPYTSRLDLVLLEFFNLNFLFDKNIRIHITIDCVLSFL